MTPGKEIDEMRLVQQILVDDHIDGLRRDAAGLRAERVRDDRHALGGVASGSRRRIGHWLVGLGQAIAGSSTDPDCGPGNTVAGAV